MSSELETLRARVRELEMQVEAAAREARHARACIDLADMYVTKLRRALEPKSARVAIMNNPIWTGEELAAFSQLSARAWKHIAPTYKVDELAERISETLRGAL